MHQLIDIVCPACGHTQPTTIWSTVNAQADPQARAQIEEMTLNVFQCERCPERFLVDVSVLYHDMAAPYCIQYVCQSDMKSAEYYRNISKRGTMLFDGQIVPQAALERSRHLFEPHFVFSMSEMALYIAFRDLCGVLGR